MSTALIIAIPVLLAVAVVAGIGTLGVVDDDRVDLSNLQRQVLFTTEAMTRPITPMNRNEPQALRLRGVV